MSDLVNEQGLGASESSSDTRDSKYIPRVWWSLGFGIAIAVFVAVMSIVSGADALMGIVLGVFAYSFVAALFFEDSAVRSVIVWMATRTIAFPGLIWEFDLDGFMWLIGMKLLFWLIGAIFGMICAVIGVIIALIISPISYVYSLVTYIREA